jgi:hypothetical protein
LIRTIILIFFFFSSLLSLRAQSDSAKVEGVKDKKTVYARARRATVMSAIIPGLGQAYNKKYWKVGIIYAGFGGLGYLFYINNFNYNQFREALILSQEPGQNGFAHGYSTTQLSTLKAQYRKNRDFAAIGLAAIYLLNIVDANVDAHLKTFDVSDDLSISVDPWQTIYNTGNRIKTANGLSIKLNF